jgi:excisionase family DNA binding protein
MTDRDDAAADPWLTLGEIAAELRVNPATVRLWVSRGELKATRAGQRKWLVRRSELDRMLGEDRRADPSPTPAADDDAPPTPASPAPQVTYVEAEEFDRFVPVDDARFLELRDALAAMKAADIRWSAALRASRNVPPAPGFADRVRAIAEAGQAEAGALRRAAIARSGGGGSLTRSPSDRISDLRLSHEMSPGANRPGPVELWDEVDATLRQMELALAGTDFLAVADAYQSLSDVMLEIADVLDEADDEDPGRLAG